MNQKGREKTRGGGSGTSYPGKENVCYQKGRLDEEIRAHETLI